MKEKFKSIPNPIKAQILLRISIGLMAMGLAVIMLAIANDFIISLPGWVLFVYMFIDGGIILYNAITNNYVTVSGQCIEIERTRIRRRVKAIYIRTEKGRMKVPIRKKIKIQEGDSVDVYMPKKTRIYDRDNSLVIFGYYAINVFSTK